MCNYEGVSNGNAKEKSSPTVSCSLPKESVPNGNNSNFSKNKFFCIGYFGRCCRSYNFPGTASMANHVAKSNIVSASVLADRPSSTGNEENFYLKRHTGNAAKYGLPADPVLPHPAKFLKICADKRVSQAVTNDFFDSANKCLLISSTYRLCSSESLVKFH